MSTVAEIKAVLPSLSEAELAEVAALLEEVRRNQQAELAALEQRSGFRAFENRPGPTVTIESINELIADEGL